MLRDVAQPDLLIVVSEIDLTGPNQWMAALGTAGIGDGIIIVAFRHLFDWLRCLHFLARRQCDVRKTAVNYVEQQSVSRFGIAIDAGLVRKFQAYPVVANPTNGAFDFA